MATEDNELPLRVFEFPPLNSVTPRNRPAGSLLRRFSISLLLAFVGGGCGVLLPLPPSSAVDVLGVFSSIVRSRRSGRFCFLERFNQPGVCAGRRGSHLREGPDGPARLQLDGSQRLHVRPARLAILRLNFLDRIEKANSHPLLLDFGILATWRSDPTIFRRIFAF